MPKNITSPHKKTPKYHITLVLLNKECKIPPETEAMLQAFYSRSHTSVLQRLTEIADDYQKAKNFMRKYYIGYGHKSIGDCASITVFVEGASMLAVKAIQDWRLFAGQESSTRYIDFSKQKIAVPRDIPKEAQEKMQNIQEEQRSFYLSAVPLIVEHLKEQFPIEEGEDQATYERAIRARGFDIARGFLPAGMTTQTSWHMNMRQFADQLALLRHHPLEEVREIAEEALQLLHSAYPDSFSLKRYDHTEEYNDFVMKKHYYLRSKDLKTKLSAKNRFALVEDRLDYKLLEYYKDVLSKRPVKTELPPFMAETGYLQFEFLLDFGSFRDIQRHRGMVQRMPLLTAEYGFHPWYIENLPQSLQSKAKELIDRVVEVYNSLDIAPEQKQYMLPMGFMVPNRITGDIKALTYFVELRVSRFVHPTLVEVASRVANTLKEKLGHLGYQLHIDPTPARFDTRRGLQTILLKKDNG